MDVAIRDIGIDKLGEGFDVYGLGDIHYGSPACAADLFKEAVQEIKHQGAYWIGMGDYVDGIVHTDRKRFDPGEFKGSNIKVEDLVDLPMKQADEVLEILDPIRDTCLAMFEGNHEWTGTKYNARDIMTYILSSMGQPWIGPSGYVKLRVSYNKSLAGRKVAKSGKKVKTSGPQYQVMFYCHHGYGGGRMSGGHALELSRQVMASSADVYMFGHRHSSLQLPEYRTWVDEQHRVRKAPVINMMTGTFQKTLVKGSVTWAEKMGFRYAVLGSPHLHIFGYTKPTGKGHKTVYRSMQQIGPHLNDEEI